MKIDFIIQKRKRALLAIETVYCIKMTIELQKIVNKRHAANIFVKK